MKRCCIAAAAAAAGLAVGGAWAQAVPAAAAASAPVAVPTAADYARPPRFAQVSVSPDGRHMAVLMRAEQGKQRQVLGVMPLAPPGPVRMLAHYEDANVTSVIWVNNQRVVFEASTDGAEVKEDGAGTVAVDIDGSNELKLISWAYNTNPMRSARIRSRLLPYGWEVLRAVGDESDDVLAQQVQRDVHNEFKQVKLARLNTRSGQLQSLDASLPAQTEDWLLDAAGQPRVAVVSDKAERRLMWRDEGSTAWRELARFDPNQDAALEPWYLGKGGELVVATRSGSGYQALYDMDVKTGKLDPQPLVAVKGYDLDASPIVRRDNHELTGLRFVADAPVTVWFDEQAQKLQAAIDAALPPGRYNRLLCAHCTSRTIVVLSSSDRHPGEYWLYDREARSIIPLGELRPWIKEASQGRRSLHWVTTRDDQRMPVYVTHPASADPKQPLPTVVLVHGGPWSRGASLAWDGEAQFLASRGWRVIEPEFRGSEGYGGAWFRAGFRQWGQAMQTDLVDALQWAAGQGLSDPTRACVMGGSYGGYASLMAPIAIPGVFRCAISFAGVTDIDLMFSVNWSDVSDAGKKYGYAVLIGSPDTDKAMLARYSPVKRAGEIKVPVLLMHGTLDQRVPIVHASKFRSAASSAGVDVTWELFNRAGHGFFYTEDEQKYYEDVERFLTKHLGH